MSQPSVADRLYSAWEQQTADYVEKVLRNPGFLELSGGLMSGVLRSKIGVDQFLVATWKSLLLPNKRDQERTLHLLNELHSRVNDIEDHLEDDEIARRKRRSGKTGELQQLSERVDHLTGLVEQLVAQQQPTRKPAKKSPRKR